MSTIQVAVLSPPTTAVKFYDTYRGQSVRVILHTTNSHCHLTVERLDGSQGDGSPRWLELNGPEALRAEYIATAALAFAAQNAAHAAAQNPTT